MSEYVIVDARTLAGADVGLGGPWEVHDRDGYVSSFPTREAADLSARSMETPNAADFKTPAVGDTCTFYSEVQEEYEPPERRLRRFTGQDVTVVAELGKPDVESSEQYTVRAADGTHFTAWWEELSGWDLELGQFFWPDATYGPDHSRDFLCNEKSGS